MKLFNAYIELEILVEEALKKFVITETEYDEIMRVAKQDGKIDDLKKKLLSRLKKALNNGTLQKISNRSSLSSNNESTIRNQGAIA